MPNIKISQLPAATTKLPCSELAVVVKSGVDRKCLRTPFQLQPARWMIALTCTGVHAPPRAVGIPRAAKARATPRSDLMPLL